jgi:hypothetical protein
MIDGDDCGKSVQWMIGKGNPSTLRKSAPVPLWPPTITWVGSNPRLRGKKPETNRLHYGTTNQTTPWVSSLHEKLTDWQLHKNLTTVSDNSTKISQKSLKTSKESHNITWKLHKNLTTIPENFTRISQQSLKTLQESHNNPWKWMVSSGMLRRVALVTTDVLEEISASFIRMTRIRELVLFLVHRFLSPWWSRREVPRKHRFLQEPRGVTSQKTPFFIVTAVKTSNVTIPDNFTRISQKFPTSQ